MRKVLNIYLTVAIGTTLGLVISKLLGFIDSSWVIVTSPMWALSLALFLLTLMTAVLLVTLQSVLWLLDFISFIERKRKEKKKNGN